jgi:probable phosphomutase (TIGR03848 family)
MAAAAEGRRAATGTIVCVTDTVAPPPIDDVETPDGAVAAATAGEAGEAAPDAPKPPRATKLLLARHAVTAQTGPLLSGRAPGIDLSDKGREQAAALGLRLAELPVAVVYASPIERTMQTAAAVAAHHGLTVQELPGVIEADYGEWTGGKIAELAKTDLWKTVQRAPSRARFPDGESMAEMQTRMVSALEVVVARHPGELVVVVSHADPIKAAIAHYSGMHLDQFQRIMVSPASVTVFELSQYGAAMVKCNDTGSLDELRPPPPRSDEAKSDESAPEESEADGPSSDGPSSDGAQASTPHEAT